MRKNTKGCACKLSRNFFTVQYVNFQEFNYKYCLDDSDKKLRGLRYQGVTIIKLRKEIILGDAETARAMDDAERSLKERNR